MSGQKKPKKRGGEKERENERKGKREREREFLVREIIEFSSPS